MQGQEDATYSPARGYCAPGSSSVGDVGDGSRGVLEGVPRGVCRGVGTPSPQRHPPAGSVDDTTLPMPGVSCAISVILLLLIC